MKEEFDENVKELIIARIESTMPSNLKLFVGGNEGITKEAMIEHVKKCDEIGKSIIRNQLNFLRAVSSGELIGLLNSV